LISNKLGKRLSFLNRYQSFWISAAMFAGVILGYSFPAFWEPLSYGTINITLQNRF
jgi:ACR3 family arsenite efflux pump ArsB